MDTKVKELITASMDKIHEMADANTIMGTPVQVDGGVTISPPLPIKGLYQAQ